MSEEEKYNQEEMDDSNQVVFIFKYFGHILALLVAGFAIGGVLYLIFGLWPMGMGRM